MILCKQDDLLELCTAESRFRCQQIQNQRPDHSRKNSKRLSSLSFLFTQIESFENGKNHIIEIGIRTMEVAINFGFNLNSLDRQVMTLLKYICENDLVHKLNLLIDLGLKLSADEDLGKYFWELALSSESFDILEKMKEFGFDPKNVKSAYTAKFRLTKWLIKSWLTIHSNNSRGSVVNGLFFK